jgi:putative transposase
MDSIKGILKPGGYRFAVDLTYLPYHGRHKRSFLEVVRSKAKSGTTHFHAYASLYVIKQNKRFTLDILPVNREMSLVEVLETFLTRLYAWDYHVKLLFLDKGFYISPVLQFLLDMRVPAVIPVVARGRSGGVRPHLRGRRSHRTTYTIRSVKYGLEVTFPLYVVCKYSGKRYGGRKGSRLFGYAVLNTHIRLDRVFEEYRKRFGIESSYKLMNVVRARTCSRDPTFRLLLVVVALLIVNYWVASQWRHVSEPRKGGRMVNHEELRLETLRRLLDSALEVIYPLRSFYVAEGG